MNNFTREIFKEKEMLKARNHLLHTIRESKTTEVIHSWVFQDGEELKRECAEEIRKELEEKFCLSLTPNPIEDTETSMMVRVLVPFPELVYFYQNNWRGALTVMGSVEKVLPNAKELIQRLTIVKLWNRPESHYCVFNCMGIKPLVSTFENAVSEIEDHEFRYVVHRPDCLPDAYMIGRVWDYLMGTCNYDDNSRLLLVKKVRKAFEPTETKETKHASSSYLTNQIVPK